MIVNSEIATIMAAQATTASPFPMQCQSVIPFQTSASAPRVFTGSSCSSGGELITWRSEFWGSRRSGSTLIDKTDEGFGRGRRRIGTESFANVCVKAEGFNFWEVLGGRGLKGGEKSTNTEDGLKALFAEPQESGKKKKGKVDGVEGRVEVSGVDGFEKELSGLVGGFPGGEKGLGKFLQDYPPPAKKEKDSKATEELDKLLRAIAGPATKAKTIVPPLLMPGMTVVVKEPRHPYYMYTGIVQRITDGRAGVLFEGGNWDKLITFKLTDLERTARGPPMTNPKSAILLLQQQPQQEQQEAVPPP